MERRATIIVKLDPLGVKEKKYFTGTEEEIYAEAHDFMNEVVMRFIDENAVENPEEQYLVADCASHTIVWDDSESITCITMYGVYERDADNPLWGIFTTRADAEEMILTECEDFAYEVMMTDDPMDVFGEEEWDWRSDYRWLMRDAGRTFSIQEVPVYK